MALMLQPADVRNNQRQLERGGNHTATREEPTSSRHGLSRPPKDHAAEKAQRAGGLPSASHRPQSREDNRHTSQLGGPSASRENRLKRPSTFLGRVHFTTSMPEPASQPKLLPLKGDPFRYTSCTSSSLERDYRHRLYLDVDMGIPLDLMDPSPFLAPPADARPPLHPEDEALLRDDDLAEARRPPEARAAGTPAARGRGAGKARSSLEGIDWLVSTQYIAPVTAASSASKKKVLDEKEAKLLALQLELGDDPQLASSREGQIRFIEETFRAAQETPAHPSNRSLEAVEVLPILPLEGREGDRFLHVVFDQGPLQESSRHARLHPDQQAALEAMAVMKQFRAPGLTKADLPGAPFLAYMVPSSAGQAERGLEEGMEVPYTWVREYLCTLQGNKGGGDRDSFLLCFEEGAVKYLRIRQKLQLNKLRKLEVGKLSSSQQQDEDTTARIPVPSKIRVRKLGDEEDDGDYEAFSSQKRARAVLDD